MANAIVTQNNAILQAINAPQTSRQYGYFEDPHGQTIYVDGFGNAHHIQTEGKLNGWTV